MVFDSNCTIRSAGMHLTVTPFYPSLDHIQYPSTSVCLCLGLDEIANISVNMLLHLQEV